MSNRAGVEITGRGVVACTGASVAAFDAAILAGRCMVGDFSDVDLCPSGAQHRYRFSHGAPVRGFDPSAHFDERTRSSLDRFSQFGTVAARQAVAEAGLSGETLSGETLPGEKLPGERIAVVIGSGNTGIDVINEAYFRYYREERKPRPLTVPMTMGSAPASRIAREVGAVGPVFGITSACASAGHAIALGLSLIRSGTVDVAIVGGTDSCFRDGYLRAWDALRVVSPDTCRPFSTGRRGLVIGEGAAILVLESSDHAKARGARSFGRLLGAGMSSDASDLIAPDAKGMGRAMRSALREGGIQAADVDYINAHGTGTVANDKLEALAIVDLFGPDPHVSVSSTKSLIGHAMGASGALEAVATLAAIAAGVVPPTANFIGPDPDCPIDVTPNAPRPRPIEFALSNSFAFGGLNVSLAFAAPT